MQKHVHREDEIVAENSLITHKQFLASYFACFLHLFKYTFASRKSIIVFMSSYKSYILNVNNILGMYRRILILFNIYFFKIILFRFYSNNII